MADQGFEGDGHQNRGIWGALEQKRGRGGLTGQVGRDHPEDEGGFIGTTGYKIRASGKVTAGALRQKFHQRDIFRHCGNNQYFPHISALGPFLRNGRHICEMSVLIAVQRDIYASKTTMTASDSCCVFNICKARRHIPGRRGYISDSAVWT